MKTQHILPLVISLIIPLSVHAGNNHSHEKKIPGPNGGRILETIDPHAEFLVTPEGKVQITFLNDSNNPMAPGPQVVSVTMGDRSAPVKLTFSPAGISLVSDQKIPAGNNLPVVVQIKPNSDAKSMLARFNLNLATCPDCKFAEYACICSHTH